MGIVFLFTSAIVSDARQCRPCLAQIRGSLWCPICCVDVVRLQEVFELSLNLILESSWAVCYLAPAVSCQTLCPPQDQRLDQAWLSRESGCAGYSVFKSFVALRGEAVV